MKNLQWLHAAMAVLGALATGLPALGTTMPDQAKYLVSAGAVCALLAVVCGAFSDSIAKEPRQ